jgi:hypothetical protein
MKIGPRELALREMRARGLDIHRKARNTTTAGDNRPRNRAKAHKESTMETKKNGADAPTIDLPADGSIPPELQREDTPEQRERIKEIVAADQRAATGAGIKTPPDVKRGDAPSLPASLTPEAQALLDQTKADEATKAKNRKERRAAASSGATREMPAQGKAALAKIAAAAKTGAPARKKSTGKGKAAAKPAKRASKAAKPGKAAGEDAARAPAPGGVKPGFKLSIIVGLLTREEGCTAKDVLEATKWPAVSMPQQARAAGLKLRTEKEGKVTRYWGAE